LDARIYPICDDIKTTFFCFSPPSLQFRIDIHRGQRGKNKRKQKARRDERLTSEVENIRRKTTPQSKALPPPRKYV